MKRLASAIYFSVATLLALGCIQSMVTDSAGVVAIVSQAILCAINVFMGVARS